MDGFPKRQMGVILTEKVVRVEVLFYRGEDGRRVFFRWRNHGVEAKRGLLQLGAAVFKELEEIEAEFIERETGQAG